MKNMKKTALICSIVGLLVISSYAAVGTQKNVVATDTMTLNIQFSTPTLKESDTYVQFDVAGANAVSYIAGRPALPMYRTKLTLPFGTKIADITCTTHTIETMVLSKKVQPAPEPVLANAQESEVRLSLDETIYASENLYPENWCTYYTGGGLDENQKHQTFLILEVSPLRYAPATDTIHYVTDMEITITTREPTRELFTATAEYKLVIIAPNAFSKDLEKLVTHKTGIGVTTLLKTTEDIYAEFTGVDKPEQIKYFIKSAIENYSTQYVLLVGGLKSYIFGAPRDDLNQGTTSWHVPVRYTNLKDEPPVFDPGYISDLYYADIYDSEGNFSSWDSNGDGIFAKWDNTPGRDVIDHYPDVYLGRLPCRNRFEVRTMVKKIIAYEKATAPSWYKSIIAVAGDSHNDTATFNFNEGELVTDKIINEHMGGYIPVKIYASNKDSNPNLTPITKNIVREISKGAGHLVFDGHGNPFSWNAHWPSYGGWTGGISVYSFPRFTNGGKLPVVVVGGCHTSQFNVTIQYSMSDKDNNSKSSWCYGVPVPESFGWWMVRKVGGGGIASIGNTGLGYGWVGGYDDLNGDGIAEPVCMEGLGGYLQILFYKTVSQETDVLGEAHSGALSKYMDTFPPMGSQIEAKTVQQWVLMGDPSMVMG
jgi:hypothetical protein